ncbi:TPR subfamily 2 repeat-containing protein [Leptolyngbya sp. PCC 7375]|nr:TPR subfamily 2 repeat-containing protein [Leptolyngbya sp. PCC 7375]
MALAANNAHIWFYRGNSLAGLKRYEEAIASYDQAIALNAQAEGPWYNKALALADLGRYGQAVEAMDQVLVINPQNTRAQELRNQWRELAQQ